MANPELFSGVKAEAFLAMQRVQDKDAIIIDLRGNGLAYNNKYMYNYKYDISGFGENNGCLKLFFFAK